MWILIAAALWICAATFVAFGVWILVKSAFPSWMRGIWKWPVGDKMSREVVRLMGWSTVIVGGACMPAAYVAASSGRTSATVLVAMAAMFLAGAGLFAWIWGVFLSHGKTL